MVVLLDEASCLGMEECVRGRGAHGPAGGSETTDVVVGGEAVARGGRLRWDAPVGGCCGRHCEGRLILERREGQSGSERAL